MTAKDIFHEAVRRSLEKEQWIITNDPLELEWEEVQVKIDGSSKESMLKIYRMKLRHPL